MNAARETTVLWWTGQLLAEDDLRRHWTNQGEIVLSPRTIVTPLAFDFLKGKRIAIRREDKASDKRMSQTVWGIAEETPSPLVAAAVKALMHEGRTLAAIVGRGIRTIATNVSKGDPLGAVIVSDQPGLAVCIANKIPGVRAASISHATEVGLLIKTLGPNLFALTTTGRTFFELRQLLKAATASPPACPETLAKTLQELDGHAHR